MTRFQTTWLIKLSPCEPKRKSIRNLWQFLQKRKAKVPSMKMLASMPELKPYKALETASNKLQTVGSSQLSSTQTFRQT